MKKITSNNLISYFKDILFLLGEERKKLPKLILLFVGLSVIEVIGIGVIAPYVGLVLGSTGFGGTKLEELLVQLTSWIPDIDPLLLIGLVLIILFLVKGVCSILINREIVRFSLRQAVRLRTWLMSSYQNLPYEQYIQRNSASYIHATQSFTTQFTATLQGLLQIVSEGIIAIAILMFLSVASGPALVLLVGLMGISLFFYDRLFKRKLQRAGKEANLQNIFAIRGLNEGLLGLKEIRVLGQELYFFDMVRKGTERWAANSVLAQVISSAPRHILHLIIIVFIVIMVNGSSALGIDRSSLLPILSMFAVAAIRLLPSVTLSTTNLTRLRFQKHAIAMLAEDLRDYNDVIYEDYTPKGRIPFPKNSEDSFQSLTALNIQFRYPNTKEWAIDNVSLELRVGEAIGLIGSSGSGKTTLVDLLLGFLEPQSGEIKYNGRLLKNSLSDWYSKTAYLPQEMFMIDDTLRRNISLGKAEVEVEMDDDLSIAIEQAQLTDLVRELPDGVETVIGERGVRLSGGQRQRVALARALYHSREVLILDEATSSLDDATEKEIVDEIRQLKGKKTLIVIAHRLSTLKECDRIYRIERGKILEQGTYQAVVGS